MTAGKLAAVKPAATTNTFLYRCPIDRATSSVLNVVNGSSLSATYRVGLRDYDQTLNMGSTGYNFKRGNVVSSFKLEITPGVQLTSLTPGTEIQLDNLTGSFKYLDFVKPNSLITIPVKTASLASIVISNVTGGSFIPGDLVTGDNNVQGTVYAYNSTSLSLSISIAGILSGDTQFLVSGDGTDIQVNDYLAIVGSTTELVQISSKTANDVTVTRGEFGTTAIDHEAGEIIRILRSSGNTTTLSSAITDTGATSISVVDASSLTTGSYLSIDDEIVLIQGIQVNNLTVTRAQLGTTASTHLNAATVTEYTDEGYSSLNFFNNGESISSGPVSADVVVSQQGTRIYNPSLKYIFDLNNTGDFSYETSLTLNVDRTYRFTQTDISNTNQSLQFLTTLQDTTPYTTGVIINGSAGSAGAYTEISISNTTPNLFTNSSTTAGLNSSITINTNPFYTEIYVYDVDGSITNTDSFETSTGSNDIVTVTSGAYGYVHDYTGAILKVSLGLNSPIFSTSSTFYDSPRTPNAERTLCTVSIASSETVIASPDYIAYDVTIDPNTTTQITALVVGPGQSIVVYSSTTNLNYVLNGFEDTTNDFSVNLYTRV